MNLPKPGQMIKCIDPDNLPEGAGPLVKGKEYEVISSRINNYGQGVVFIKGVPNNGRTSKGFEWNGYNVRRFGTTLEDVLAESETKEEVVPVLN
jgi:hypothetical protein